ncbi:MAG: hypothetical protein NMK33_05475 [Candidatus Cardinium sp.]|uniref:hypothetical protein n=1 Tax=Cardinium endosymbiont of Dermatophagoides farinae TaxID=2597823 RepID=UPI001181DA2A|nr:hypothetical protein [Cardinium endosymbiont of Dermatophagoides farinae]TSJ80861.1 hypothetical protein FPG78_02275 [Cardinium endosymbiont of Dermatophagoides farinae]UWW96868.1 MAG: hypothetical protein NMK33_05475 [Candidatus Cardinium sp.]
MSILLHCLASFLLRLFFISCNSVYLGHNNTNDNPQNIPSPSSRSSESSVIPPTPSGSECVNGLINNFKGKLIQHIKELIKLDNVVDNDDKAKKAIFQLLYHLIVCDQDKRYFIGVQLCSSDSDSDMETYITYSNKILAITVDPKKYFKYNFQQPYSNVESSSDTELMKQLGNAMFDRMKYQIIHIIKQSRADLKLGARHREIVGQIEKYIKKIMHFRFKTGEGYQDNIFNIFKDCVNKDHFLKTAVAPDEASIYQCLADYFNKLKLKYYDPIQQMGELLLNFIKKNITSLYKMTLI